MKYVQFAIDARRGAENAFIPSHQQLPKGLEVELPNQNQVQLEADLVLHQKMARKIAQIILKRFHTKTKC